MSATAQRCRVLAMLRNGPVTIEMTDRQPAADGGARITRLAARIDDLKRKDGHTITSRRVRLGESTVAEYTLVLEAGQPASSAGFPAALAEIPAPTSFGPLWADATNPQRHTPSPYEADAA